MLALPGLPTHRAPWSNAVHVLIISWVVILASQAACLGQEWECGPPRGLVRNVVDGDTIDLASGQRIRYLMVDTPERRGPEGTDCFALEATRFNRDLVLGREVELRYDAQCTDRFGRLLAYVSVDGVEINTRLVERGYACVLYIPPNGKDRRQELLGLEELARSEKRGMWGACRRIRCE